MNIMPRGLLREGGLWLALMAPLAAIILVFGATTASADLYKWEDSDGVLHITDDLGKVPESKRGSVKVFKIKPRPRKGPEDGHVYIPATKRAEKKVVLYGGQPLEWWEEAFAKLIDERDFLEDDIEKKRQFITVFEGGRRFGQIFGDAEIANYKKYKKDIIRDRERLAEVEAELEKLRREARIEDVPRDIIPE